MFLLSDQFPHAYSLDYGLVVNLTLNLPQLGLEMRHTILTVVEAISDDICVGLSVTRSFGRVTTDVTTFDAI